MDLTDFRVLRLFNSDPSIPVDEFNTSEYTITFPPNDPLLVRGRAITCTSVSYVNVIPTIFSEGPNKNDFIYYRYYLHASQLPTGTKREAAIRTLTVSIRSGKYTVSELVDELNRSAALLPANVANGHIQPAVPAKGDVMAQAAKNLATSLANGVSMNVWRYDPIRQALVFKRLPNVGVDFTQP